MAMHQEHPKDDPYEEGNDVILVSGHRCLLDLEVNGLCVGRGERDLTEGYFPNLKTRV